MGKSDAPLDRGQLGDVTEAAELTCERLRELIIQTCGIDPGGLQRTQSLDQISITGFNRLRLALALEDLFGIELPADLLSALDTVDDLIYYTETKIEHRL